MRGRPDALLHQNLSYRNTHERVLDLGVTCLMERMNERMAYNAKLTCGLSPSLPGLRTGVIRALSSGQGQPQTRISLQIGYSSDEDEAIESQPVGATTEDRSNEALAVTIQIPNKHALWAN
ncbi:hypothetical protein Scep_017333 [Stephania cephalantha]|uniref:Uncharacterized protein n=1 Tax=Stephania cephalantha TaxID=152367 RepID=A0AAP0IPV8_9MAGN